MFYWNWRGAFLRHRPPGTTVLFKHYVTSLNRGTQRTLLSWPPPATVPGGSGKGSAVVYTIKIRAITARENACGTQKMVIRDWAYANYLPHMDVSLPKSAKLSLSRARLEAVHRNWITEGEERREFRA